MEYSAEEGPERIIPTTNITTTDPDGVVKLRPIDSEDEDIAPESIPGLLKRIAELYPDKPALGYKKNPDEKGFHIITYREYRNLVRTIAKAFIKLGLERYHSVAIIGFNSPEWFISYLAAVHAGGFATGIYTTNSPEACFYCLENCRANIVVAEDHDYVEKIFKYRKDLPHLKKIIQYEGSPAFNDILSWKDLLRIGQAEDDTSLNNVLKSMAVNECALLVYTSGTIGKPKPAMISHDNIVYNSKISVRVTKVGSDDTTISYLPLSHVAAQILDIMVPLTAGGSVYFADKKALKGTLIQTLKEVRPTCFWGVPRVFEKFAEKMREIGAQANPILKIIANWAKSQGLRRHMDLIKGIDNPSYGYLLARAFILSKVKQNLGLDRCRLIINGAAPLSMDTKMYFASLDMLLLDGYGMTETSGPQTVNLQTAFRFEGVGKIIPGVKLKIVSSDKDGSGEICMNGRCVFMGYLNERKTTDEAIDSEGWLHSGDIGKIDEDGFIHLTGRQKEILITSGGENIAPVTIEDAIKKELPCLGYAVLIGDQKKYLTVLLTLSCEVEADTGEPSEDLTGLAKKWLEDLGCPFKTITQVIASGPDKKILGAIQQAIDEANLKAISNAQRVQKFALLPHDFSMVTGELGPTLKLRRNIVTEKYKDVIDGLYSS